MIADLTLALLAVLAGSLGMLWLLLIWFGDGMVNPEIGGHVDPILGAPDQPAIYSSYEPYIPMPEDLRTSDEMVAWMTKELPRLTAEQRGLRSSP